MDERVLWIEADVDTSLGPQNIDHRETTISDLSPHTFTAGENQVFRELTVNLDNTYHRILPQRYVHSIWYDLNTSGPGSSIVINKERDDKGVKTMELKPILYDVSAERYFISPYHITGDPDLGLIKRVTFYTPKYPILKGIEWGKYKSILGIPGIGKFGREYSAVIVKRTSEVKEFTDNMTIYSPVFNTFVIVRFGISDKNTMKHYFDNYGYYIFFYNWADVWTRDQWYDGAVDTNVSPGGINKNVAFSRKFFFHAQYEDGEFYHYWDPTHIDPNPLNYANRASQGVPLGNTVNGLQCLPLPLPWFASAGGVPLKHTLNFNFNFLSV